MKTHLSRILISLALSLMVPARLALAHGKPVIAVEPLVVAAGGQITVTGAAVEPGEVFSLSLAGMNGSTPLGEATVTGEGEDGEFTVTLTIPADTPPGSYIVRAVTEAGKVAAANLTVTAPTDNASGGPAMVLDEASGELHAIDRSKPIGQIVAVIILIVISTGGGVYLIRRKD